MLPYREKREQLMGKIELFTDKKGQTRFRLKNATGEPILASVPFNKTTTVFTAIEHVRADAGLDERYQRNKSESGYSFTFVTADQQPLARSEVYTTSAARDQGIAVVKENAAAAEVVDKRVP